MILSHSNYMILSANANTPFWEHWEAEPYPTWAALTGIAYVFDIPTGNGIEPHYHDCDEFWLFGAGRGEGGMDTHAFEITPNTVVYNPMGVMHRFQLFRAGGGAGVIARLERQKRPGHLYVEEAGMPQPTVPGFVIPGNKNHRAFDDRGTRCPLSELRMVTAAADSAAAAGQTPSHEYWMVIEGGLHLAIHDLSIDLSQGDLAILRAGSERTITADLPTQVLLARE